MRAGKRCETADESAKATGAENDRVSLQSEVLERVQRGVFPLLVDKDRCTSS